MPGAFAIAFELLNIAEVVRGFESIAKFVAQADKSVGSIASAIRSTGGSAGDVGAVGGFARLSGQDPLQSGTLARGLRERIAGSPLAQGLFGQGVLPSGTGQLTDEAKLYRSIARQILEDRSDEEARIKAQVAGMEDLLPMRDAEPRLIRKVIAESERYGRLVDKNLRTERANLQALQILRETAWDRLGLKIEKETLPIREAFEKVSAAAGGFVEAQPSTTGFFARIAKDLGQGGIPAIIGDFVGEALGKKITGGGGKAATAPVDKQVAAMQDLTLELVALRKEFLNDRGGRAAGAVPRGLRGKALDKYLENAARDLGAVTF